MMRRQFTKVTKVWQNQLLRIPSLSTAKRQKNKPRGPPDDMAILDDVLRGTLRFFRDLYSAGLQSMHS